MDNQQAQGAAHPQKLRRRSSFFGFNDAEAKPKPDNEDTNQMENRIQKLISESKEWPWKFHETKAKLKRYWDNISKELTLADLPACQQDYIQRSINLTRYAAINEEFIHKVKMFSRRKEWFYEQFVYCIELLEEKIVHDKADLQMRLKYEGK